MARDRFGFLKRHGASNAQSIPIDQRSAPLVAMLPA
jgi:hypothetical protein